jgi:hypothetical protein
VRRPAFGTHAGHQVGSWAGRVARVSAGSRSADHPVPHPGAGRSDGGEVWVRGSLSAHARSSGAGPGVARRGARAHCHGARADPRRLSTARGREPAAAAAAAAAGRTAVRQACAWEERGRRRRRRPAAVRLLLPRVPSRGPVSAERGSGLAPVERGAGGAAVGGQSGARPATEAAPPVSPDARGRRESRGLGR